MDTLPDRSSYVGRPLQGRVTTAHYVPLEALPGSAYLYRADVQVSAGSADLNTLPQRAVVKVLRPQATSQGGPREKMEFTCHLLAAGRSPYVAAVRDWGYTDDQLSTRFLVLDYLPGGTLYAALRRRRWPLASRLAAFDHLLSAVRALADANVVHSDLKLTNIVLASPADIRAVRLIDFGQAQTVDAAAPLPSPGTPGMRAPEQLASRPLVSLATDVFTLAYSGVALFWGLEHAARLGQAVEGKRLVWRLPEVETGWSDRLRVWLGQGVAMPRLAALFASMMADDARQRPTASHAQRTFRALCGSLLRP